MALKASNYKNYCSENISPQAWARVILKCLTLVKERGLSLGEMEKTEPDIQIDDELQEALNAALMELYEISIDESSLINS